MRIVLLSILLATLASCKPSKNIISISGSDTMAQLSQHLVVAYMKQNKEVRISVRGGGSGTGIAAIINGSTEIATASRKMKKKEMAMAAANNAQINEHVIALDGIAVLVHKNNPVKELNIEQLSQIFAGKITNWQQLGGKDQPIFVLSRENNSGTHVYFKEEVLRKGDKKLKLEFGPRVSYAISSQQIIDQVKTKENAIAYVGMGWLSDEVKGIKINDGQNSYAPSVANVQAGNYPIARSLQMYTRKNSDGRDLKFINFVMSEPGQAVVKRLGFVPIK